MSPKEDHAVTETIHLTEQNYDEALLATPGLAMIDFWAEWCGPCRAIAPVLEQIAASSEGRVTLMKVNVDEHPALAARYEIRSIPTILFVKGGEVVESIVGAVPKATLQAVIDAQA
jgi:thioredoxin 1